MSYNMATDPNIIEITHNCSIKSLLTMLAGKQTSYYDETINNAHVPADLNDDNNGGYSPGLSVNVVVKGYNINPDFNKWFGKNKIYIKKEKLNLGENFFILGGDFYSNYYNNIDDFFKDIYVRLIDKEGYNNQIFPILYNAIYYPDEGFIGTDKEFSYLKNMEEILSDLYSGDFDEIYFDDFNENIIEFIYDLLYLVTNGIVDKNDYITDFSGVSIRYLTNILGSIQLQLFKGVQYDLNINESLKNILEQQDFIKAILDILNILYDFLEFQLQEGSLDKEYENILEKIGQLIYYFQYGGNTILDYINDKNIDLNSFLLKFKELLKQTFTVQQMTEGKIIMEKVPVTFWKKVIIDSNEYNKLPEKEQNLLKSKLNEYGIYYEIV